ncbi:hypothetical protein ACO2RV_21325 [Ancylobacter sp. VNQ12]|uniref:hypothetical protein n=1 Tax=Ancylobacter sp. VNQ12 TaxID=3400920 RepID=UPI003C03D671
MAMIQGEDGILDLQLAIPKELGGMGGAANPEPLFAGGYAACFENALLRVARQSGHRFADGDVEVVAEIGLSRNEADAMPAPRITTPSIGRRKKNWTRSTMIWTAAAARGYESAAEWLPQSLEWPILIPTSAMSWRWSVTRSRKRFASR